MRRQQMRSNPSSSSASFGVMPFRNRSAYFVHMLPITAAHVKQRTGNISKTSSYFLSHARTCRTHAHEEQQQLQENIICAAAHTFSHCLMLQCDYI